LPSHPDLTIREVSIMFNRMHQRNPAKTAARREADASGLEFMMSAADRSEVSLADILASLSADSADPDAQIRALEDKIRRQWATLRDLVREHAALTRRGLVAPVPDDAPIRVTPPVDRVAAVQPKVQMFVRPPRRAGT